MTSLTLSQEQLELAQQRVREAGLADRVEIRLCDYRDVEGVYDRLVSVEMFEAVGYEYYGEFFGRASRLLRPGGLFLMQTITVPYNLPEDWRPIDWSASYTTGNGQRINLTTIFPAADTSSRRLPVRLAPGD